MIKVEITHKLDIAYPTGIELTQKTWRLFGVVVWQKTHHYPKVKDFEILFDF